MLASFNDVPIFPLDRNIGDTLASNLRTIPSLREDYPDLENFDIEFSETDLHHPCDEEFDINLFPLLNIREENEAEELADDEDSGDEYEMDDVFERELAQNHQDLLQVPDPNERRDDENAWRDIESDDDIDIEILIEYELVDMDDDVIDF